MGDGAVLHVPHEICLATLFNWLRHRNEAPKSALHFGPGRYRLYWNRFSVPNPISKAKGHDKVIVVARGGVEGSPPLVPLMDTDKMVGIPEVKLGTQKPLEVIQTGTGILKGSCSALEKRGNTLNFVTATPPSPGRIFRDYFI